MVKSRHRFWTTRASDGDLLLPTELLHIELMRQNRKFKKYISQIFIFRTTECGGIKTYLTHALYFWVFGVEIFLEFRQLVEVPPLFAETLTRISKLHGRGSTTAPHAPSKPWPKRAPPTG